MCFARELRSPDDVRQDLRAIVDGVPFVSQITPYLRNFAGALKEARANQEQQQDRRKLQADQRRRPAVCFRVWDKVLVKTHALSKASQGFTSKFAPRRDGPYVITFQKSPTTFQIAAPDATAVPLGVYHVSALTPFVPPATVPVPLKPIRRRGRPHKTAKPESTAPCSARRSHRVRRSPQRLSL
ncbi:hypothetical protein J437_LFUL013503 [Ladona fulva]|uniref:Uncharacterized protein n=1 Tax=Ladona fulva TaxID=123851 RepID=A0A8K0KKI3_LADFU|nr:hypothetical protein J437_LFUL013503 [Ladona fulva]